MASRITVEAEAFTAGLAAAAARLRVDGERSLDRLAHTAEREAKQLCPVDTGRLRAGIHVESGTAPEGPYRDVVVDAEYGPFVEFGTSRSPAQPFLRPGVAAAIKGGLT